MLIKWQDINSVNIREFDEHHKVIVEIINELNNDLSEPEIKNIIEKLKNYAEFHFEAEESYFRQYNFPKTESHTKQHQFFTEKVKSFEKKNVRNEVEINELMDFLSSWWIGHINHSDLEYSTFLNQRGVY